MTLEAYSCMKNQEEDIEKIFNVDDYVKYCSMVDGSVETRVLLRMGTLGILTFYVISIFLRPIMLFHSYLFISICN